jgi:hypothetical protein
VVLAEHGLESLHERDIRIPDSILGDAKPVPRPGPRGLELRRPLELSGAVVIPGSTAEVAQPHRHEPEPQVMHRVLAVRLGDRDEPLFQLDQRRAVVQGVDRVPELGEQLAILGGLRLCHGRGAERQADAQVQREGKSYAHVVS